MSVRMTNKTTTLAIARIEDSVRRRVIYVFTEIQG